MPHGPEGGGAEGMREAEDGAEGNAKHIVPESVSPASMGRLVGDDKEAAAERERRRAAVEAANAQLPPTGLSMRRPEHQQV